MESVRFSPPSKVLASAADGIVGHIARHGGDVDSIFGRASIRTDQLDSPCNELNLGQFCKLFDEAAAQTAHDNFGLEFGASYQPKQLGPIGYAAISSPTLFAALRCLEHYFPAHQGQTTLSLGQDRDLLWLHYRIFDERVLKKRQDAELSMGVFVNIFRHVLGQSWCPLEVNFEHQRPDQIFDHERLFGAPVLFGRQSNSIAFRRSDLEARMPDQDSYLYSIIEPYLKSRRSLDSSTDDFASLVREQVRSLMKDRVPTVSEVTSSLGISDNEFQKKLRTQSLVFRDLVKAVRQEMALHYLNNDDLSLTEIAFRLGYSELSAFSRAFRSWTGQSPQRYRRLNSDN